MPRMTKTLAVKVPDDLHERFLEHAKRKGTKPSAILLDHVVSQLAQDGQVLTAERVEPEAKRMFWFRRSDGEKERITEAARDRGMTVSEFIRAVVMTHINRRPRFSTDEADALRDVAGAIRKFCGVLDQMNEPAAAAAGDRLREEVLSLIGKMVRGNMDYWAGAEHSESEVPEIELAAD